MKFFCIYVNGIERWTRKAVSEEAAIDWAYLELGYDPGEVNAEEIEETEE